MAIIYFCVSKYNVCRNLLKFRRTNLSIKPLLPFVRKKITAKIVDIRQYFNIHSKRRLAAALEHT